MKSLSGCPTELLSRFLDDSLGAEQSSSIEMHLESCQKCRSVLESECGESSLWTGVASLSDDEFDRDWSGFSLNSLRRIEDAQGDTSGQRETRLRAVFESIKHLLSPSDDPQSVGRIGSYEVTGLIGSGGMGVVLKAKDPALDRVVAIKLLAPHLAAFETARIRFQREAKAAAAVKHDAIIPIYGVDTHRGTPYFVMPYEVGPSLQQRIEQHGKLTIEESLRVASQIAAALAAAHQSGLVHRDIKPSNILLAPGTERALLTDFGLAQAGSGQTITASGLLAGTPMFMSPEQARGEAVDSRSDLFSLGSVLFMMLTGQPPVDGESTFAIVRKIGGDSMPRLHDADPSAPMWLNTLVSRLHQFEIEKRIRTADESTMILNDCLAHVQNPREHGIPRSLISVSITKTSSLIRASVWLVLTAIVLAGVYWMGDRWLSNPPNPSLDLGHRSMVEPDSNSVEEFPSMPESAVEWDDGLDETIDEIWRGIAELNDNEFDFMNE